MMLVVMILVAAMGYVLIGPGALVVVALLALWGVSLLVYPEKRCWACKGAGSHQGPFGLMRTCGECGGSGRVRRIGAGE